MSAEMQLATVPPKETALQVYPADKDVVNVANMRHLWLPTEPVAFAWRRS